MSKSKQEKRRKTKSSADAPQHAQHPGSNSETLAEELSKELGAEFSPQVVEKLGRLVETRVELVVQDTLVTRFSGPLPHPNVLAEYDRIRPGLLDRIVKMAESQAAHRQAMEAIVVRGNAWMGKAGVIFGGTIGIAGLLVIALAIYKQAPLQYLGGILAALATLAGLFVWSRRKKVRDAQKLQEGMKALFTGSTGSGPRKGSHRSVPASRQRGVIQSTGLPPKKSGS